MSSWTEKADDWLAENMSCKRFARHVSSLVEPLEGGLYSRFHFWLHWTICPFCRRYWEELKAIGQIQKANSALSRHPAVKIPEVKQRLKEKLLKRAQ
jgi:hypothetical protein